VPSISLTESTGDQLTLIVDGDPGQNQPWNIYLTPEAAYNLGNAMAMYALKKMQGRAAFPASTSTGGTIKPAGKPMQKKINPALGPTTSVDGQGGSLFAPPPSLPSGAPDLLGDDFK
jgi:hypothetical protein